MRAVTGHEQTLALVADLLLESPYLMSLRSDDIRSLCNRGELVELSPAERLMNADADYLVLDGLLAVTTTDYDSGAKGVGLFGPGEQLIWHPSSRVKATTDVLLLRLPDTEAGPCVVYEYGDDDEAALVNL